MSILNIPSEQKQLDAGVAVLGEWTFACYYSAKNDHLTLSRAIAPVPVEALGYSLYGLGISIAGGGDIAISTMLVLGFAQFSELWGEVSIPEIGYKSKPFSFTDTPAMFPSWNLDLKSGAWSSAAKPPQPLPASTGFFGERGVMIDTSASPNAFTYEVRIWTI